LGECGWSYLERAVSTRQLCTFEPVGLGYDVVAPFHPNDQRAIVGDPGLWRLLLAAVRRVLGTCNFPNHFYTSPCLYDVGLSCFCQKAIASVSAAGNVKCPTLRPGLPALP